MFGFDGLSEPAATCNGRENRQQVREDAEQQKHRDELREHGQEVVQPQGTQDLHDREQRSSPDPAPGGKRQVLSQQNVAPGGRRQDEHAKAVAVESRIDCPSTAASRRARAPSRRWRSGAGSPRGSRCDRRQSIEPKIGIMINGVSNIIFASGDRTSERKPASAIAETGSDKPGRRASSKTVLALAAL